LANHIVLFEPQNPHNSGNIARTCAGTNTVLHFILPLGFDMKDKQLKRAGLDYWESVEIHYHQTFSEFLCEIDTSRLFVVSNQGEEIYSDKNYSETGDYYFLFGNESGKLPENSTSANHLCVPMNNTHIEALNLSNMAALVIFEVLRQQGFPTMALSYDNEKIER